MINAVFGFSILCALCASAVNKEKIHRRDAEDAERRSIV
jgi:hypothetical protein